MIDLQADDAEQRAALDVRPAVRRTKRTINFASLRAMGSNARPHASETAP